MGARPILAILAVEDVVRAKGFYAAAFGWPVTVDVPVYVEMEAEGGFRIGLYERRSFGRNTNQVPIPVPAGHLSPAEVYLRVDDVAASTDRATRAGGRLLSPPSRREWGDEVAYVADPDGHVLALARE